MRNRLRALRKQLGISGEQLANAAGFTRQAYSQLERGTMAARPETMTPINAYLRRKRVERLAQLRNEIEFLISFDIDETLYLKERKS